MFVTRRIFIVASVFLLTCRAVGGEVKGQCPDGPQTSSLNLRTRLLCNYDRSVRPSLSFANKTQVTISQWLKNLSFNDRSSTLTVHSFMIYRWKDDHLTWDPAQYSNVMSIQMPSEDIWMPDVTIRSPAAVSAMAPQLPNCLCNVGSNGIVTCIVPTVQSGLCSADITRWPFDTHNCSLQLSSWSNREIALALSGSGLSVSETSYTKNREWDLERANATVLVMSFKYNGTNNTFNRLGFQYSLRRHPGGHLATVLVPALVLTILALVVFWMRSFSERLGLICVNILGHVLYLQYLGMQLPANGDKCPIILIFYRDSLLMVGLSLVISLFVRTMNAASSVPPPWITSLMDAVPDLVLLGGGEDEGKKWRRCSVLLDRVAFICYLITFIVLIMAYIP